MEKYRAILTDIKNKYPAVKFKIVSLSPVTLMLNSDDLLENISFFRELQSILKKYLPVEARTNFFVEYDYFGEIDHLESVISREEVKTISFTQELYIPQNQIRFPFNIRPKYEKSKKYTNKVCC